MKVFTDIQVREILAYANDLAKMVEADKVPLVNKEEALSIVVGIRNMVNLAETFEVNLGKKEGK
jgi:hypothetical protein